MEKYVWKVQPRFNVKLSVLHVQFNILFSLDQYRYFQISQTQFSRKNFSRKSCNTKTIHSRRLYAKVDPHQPPQQLERLSVLMRPAMRRQACSAFPNYPVARIVDLTLACNQVATHTWPDVLCGFTETIRGIRGCIRRSLSRMHICACISTYVYGLAVAAAGSRVCRSFN